MARMTTVDFSPEAMPVKDGMGIPTPSFHCLLRAARGEHDV